MLNLLQQNFLNKIYIINVCSYFKQFIDKSFIKYIYKYRNALDIYTVTI